MNSDITFVTGGTGKTGRRVAERLVAHGLPVRIGSRRGDPPFDWEDAATWEPVLAGARSVYVTYVPDLAFPGADERVRSFARLAVQSGVRRIILLSGRNEPGALLSEHAIQACGAEWTVVRSSFMSQNFSESFWLEPILHGELSVPAGDVAEPFVDAEDIADVVVAALTSDDHAGRVYDVTGPRLLTFPDAIGLIAAATGREIRYVPVSLLECRDGLLAAGMPSDFAAWLAQLFGEVLDGRNAHVTDGVRQALGREPRDFADYVRTVAASGAWDQSRAALVGQRAVTA